MQLNLSTDYALRSLLVLADSDDGVSSSDISHQIGIEREFTLKILRQLHEGGFVEAIRGRRGGYKLSRPLAQISLLEVLSHMEDSMYINRCLEPDHFCSRNGVNKGCAARNFYLAFQTRLENMLGNISLQDIIDNSYSFQDN